MEDRDDYPIIPQVKGSEDLYLKLLPCPFCDTQPEWINEALPDSHFYIKCSHCHIVMKEDRRDKVIGMWNRREELASLKEENAKLKFRADLMAIYKQEKEDRDKILHQIKCTLYDRLTETEKLNDILKFFPTAIKTFSDNK